MAPPPLKHIKTRSTAILGFSLIELLAVIALIAILSAIALPRFQNLSAAARIATLEMLAGSARSTNALIIAKVRTGSGVQEVQNRDDLLDIDIDDDGTYETRLKWGYLDNTDLEKWLNISNELVISYSGISLTYIGYDLDGNGDANNDNCYFLYTQANAEDSLPVYEIIESGCN